MKNYEVHGELSFDCRTPKVVREIIHYAYTSRKRVRVFLGDTETGRDWMEEFYVTGTIGRSTGTTKIPLILSSRRSMAGPALLDHCIVKIAVEGIVKWTHPKYFMPDIRYREGDVEGFRYEVLVNGDVHARFKTEAKRARWVAFMQGKRKVK